MDDGTVSVSEAAAILGVHRNTVHYRIQHGRLKAERTQNTNGETVWRVYLSSLKPDDKQRKVLGHQGKTRNALTSKDQQAELMTLLAPFIAQFGDAQERTGRAEAERDAAQLDAQRERDRANALELQLQRLRGTTEPVEQAAPPRPRSIWERLRQR
jgi:excisionase family DNA binding protein